MIRLKIEEKRGKEYILRDVYGKSYNLNIEFFDVEEEPKENDYISMSAELLNTNYREYSRYFSIGGLDNICGRKQEELTETDEIIVEIGDKEIHLKRLYG